MGSVFSKIKKFRQNRRRRAGAARPSSTHELQPTSPPDPTLANSPSAASTPASMPAIASPPATSDAVAKGVPSPTGAGSAKTRPTIRIPAPAPATGEPSTTASAPPSSSQQAPAPASVPATTHTSATALVSQPQSPEPSAPTSVADTIVTDSSSLPSTSSKTAQGSIISTLTPWGQALAKIRNKGIPCPNPGNANSIQLVQQLIAETKSKKEECDAKRLFYKNSSGEKVFYADKLLKQLNKYAAIGDIAIQHHPDVVALAWSGFRLLLQVGTAYVENMELVSDSLEYLMSVIFCGEIYEKLYSGTGLTVAGHLNTCLVDLYASILEYLGYAIQYLGNNTAVRIVESFSSEMKRLLGVVQVLERLTKDKADMAEKEAAEKGRFEQEARAEELKRLLDELQKPMLQMQHAVMESYRKIEGLWKYVEEKKREEVLRWVSDVEYGSHHLEIQSQRHPDTGNWLLEDKNVYDWENTSLVRIFWLRGDPGSGKTMLASKMVDALRGRRTNQHALAYFYCYFQEKARRNPESVLRAIVKQLCIAYSREGLPQPLMDAYELRQKEGHSTGPLHSIESKKLIIELLRKFSQTIILIDALDECDQETRGELFRILKELSTENTVKLFLTSRNESDIRDFLYQVPNLYIDATASSGDIKKYINTKVEQFCDGKPRFKDDLELKNEIISTLEAKATGMFMWVSLQIRAMRLADTVKDIKNILQNLPQTLNDTYANIIQRIRGDNVASERAFTILRWVFYAQGVCSPDVVRQALIIEPMKPDRDPNSLLELSQILDNCRNLLVHDTKLNVLRFAHFSVKEFLLQLPEFSPDQAHTEIAEMCLTVLNSDSNFEAQTCPIPELLEYCIFNWGAHARQSGYGSTTLKQLWVSFLDPSLGCYRSWASKVVLGSTYHDLHKGDQEEFIHPLWTACYYQLYDPFEYLLRRFDNPDCRNKWGVTPLLHAAEYGYEQFVKLLLLQRDGVDVNSKDRDGYTPLSRAASKGQEKIVELLLQRDEVDVNSKGRYGSTPLSQAASDGHQKIVELLLQRDGVDMNSKDEGGHTPLSRAAFRGHEKIVELLLQRDEVDVDSKDRSGSTPLSWAASKGHEKIVELLLQGDGVDVDSKNRDGRTPLSRAASKGHEKIVELLLQRDGVDVDSKDNYGSTPLSLATSGGYGGIVELLLQRDGVDVDSKDNYGSTPLSLAASGGYGGIVELLLQRDGVDVDSKDRDGRTPLSRAASKGHEKIVELLLQRDGVDVDSKDNYGSTPLSLAAFRGHEKIVELLLQGDEVDVDSKNRDGRTPLSRAASKGHEKIVELLLQRDGVGVDSKSRYGSTPLSLAASGGHEKVVELLLQRDGVDVNSEDDGGHTPLSQAASGGYKKIVKLLLQRDGVDVNSKDRSGYTPLSWAAENGHKKVVELLLQKDSIEINKRNGRDLTPRELAAKRGHSHIVKLLSM